MRCASVAKQVATLPVQHSSAPFCLSWRGLLSAPKRKQIASMLVQLSFTSKQLEFALVRVEPMLGSCDLADKQLKSAAMQVASLSMRSESKLVQLVQKQKQFAQKSVQVELV